MLENQHCRGLPMVTCVARPHVGRMGLQISAKGGDLLPHATLPLGGDSRAFSNTAAHEI